MTRSIKQRCYLVHALAKQTSCAQNVVVSAKRS